MKLKYKILFTLANIGMSALILYGLESMSVLFPFIMGCVMVAFNGAVLDYNEDL